MASKSNKSHGIVWFRRDLRLNDNPALTEACFNHDQITGIYFLTPRQWQQHHVGTNHQWFVLEHLRDLRKTINKLNIPLLVIQCDRFSDCPQQLAKLASQHNADAVYTNIEWELNERARDKACEAALNEKHIAFKQFNDQTIALPGTVTTKSGQFYKVFTPFKKAFINQVHRLDAMPHPKPAIHQQAANISAIDQGAIPSVIPTCKKIWRIGETQARHSLTEFLKKDIFQYKHLRDFPAKNLTSRLSPYLAVGAISFKTCFYEALNINDQCIESGNKDIACWINELIWREFYKHLLAGFPHVCQHKPFNPTYATLPWRNDQKSFQAWCEGRTGYPLVDAAMKQLIHEGWMHNRLRMVVAMFLTKHLLIDWRWGEKFFAKHLIDLDLSANNGGWQWSASTGADAAPYFRIFNPTRQSKRFDPEGNFIRQYLPALSSLTNKTIHAPNKKEAEELKYPAPMIDHGFSVDRAKQTFQAAKSEPSILRQ